MKTNTKTMNNNEMLVRDSQSAAGLQVKTNLKAGIIRKPAGNHNETLVRDSQPGAGLKVKTNLKAGLIHKPVGNHNETLATGRNESPKSDGKAAPAAGVKVQTGLKAGIKGESTDKDHKDWVSIFRFSHVGVYFGRNLAAGLTTITV